MRRERERENVCVNERGRETERERQREERRMQCALDLITSETTPFCMAKYSKPVNTCARYIRCEHVRTALPV